MSDTPKPIYEGWTALAQFRQGSGVMAMNAVDYWLQKDGKTIRRHEWSQGGEGWRTVDNVPESEPLHRCTFHASDSLLPNV